MKGEAAMSERSMEGFFYADFAGSRGAAQAATTQPCARGTRALRAARYAAFQSGSGLLLSFIFLRGKAAVHRAAAWHPSIDRQPPAGCRAAHNAGHGGGLYGRRFVPCLMRADKFLLLIDN